MKEITRKLIEEQDEKVKIFIEEARKEGMDEGKIIDALKNYLAVKTKNYYRKPDFTAVGKCFDVGKLKSDSKIEQIFYDALKDNKIPFEFQVSIGRYRADYLINKFLVVEVDGPQHEQPRDDIRDAYMRRLGYKILRVPTWLLCMDSKAVIESIVEVIGQVAAMPKGGPP